MNLFSPLVNSTQYPTQGWCSEKKQEGKEEAGQRGKENRMEGRRKEKKRGRERDGKEKGRAEERKKSTLFIMSRH